MHPVLLVPGVEKMPEGKCGRRSSSTDFFLPMDTEEGELSLSISISLPRHSVLHVGLPRLRLKWQKPKQHHVL